MLEIIKNNVFERKDDFKHFFMRKFYFLDIIKTVF